MPSKQAHAVRGTVAGRRVGALKGGYPAPRPPRDASLTTSIKSGDKQSGGGGGGDRTLSPQATAERGAAAVRR